MDVSSSSDIRKAPVKPISWSLIDEKRTVDEIRVAVYKRSSVLSNLAS